MGLCSLAFAALGANVLSTDIHSVLPLLTRNCSSNMSPTALDGGTLSTSNDMSIGVASTFLYVKTD